MHFKISLKSKIIGLCCLMVILFNLVMIIILKPMLRKMMEDERETAIRHVVELMHSIAVGYKSEATQGSLNDAEAKRLALATIKKARYANNDYIWINDTTLPYPKMIMHATVPSLDGKELNLPKFNCARSIKFGKEGTELTIPLLNKNLFQSAVEVCLKSGDGFVTYHWPKPKNGGVTDELYPKRSYVKLFEPWGWVIGSGLYIDDLDLQLSRIEQRIYIASFSLCLFSVMVGFIVGHRISKPIKFAIEGLSAASTQVAIASHQLAEGSSTQAASIVQTASSLETMASTAKTSAQNTEKASALMKSVQEQIRLGEGSIQTVLKVEGESSVKRLLEAIESIQKSTVQTAQIVKTINEIAFQTNLLALNASVEAARAGQAGAGFAVVADAVRNLAGRSAQAADSTSALIQSSQKSAEAGVKVSQDVRDSLIKIEKEVSHTLQAARTGTDHLALLMDEIAAAVHQQAIGAKQISESTQAIEDIVQRNAASSEESAGAAKELEVIVHQLRLTVSGDDQQK